MIVEYTELAVLREKYREGTIAYCAGVFDLLHEGHLDILGRLHSFGDVAIVGVASDERVKFRKGPNRPIQPERTRLAVIDALKDVDYSFLYPNLVPGYEIIGHFILEQVQPDFFLSSDTVWEEDREWLAGMGIELQIIPRFSDEISTTQTIQKVLKTHSTSSF